MPLPIEFYYDFVSPTAYLAHTRMAGIAERTGAEIVYVPMFLGGVMKATGNSPPMTVPAKGGYLLRDLTRFAEREDVAFAFNPNFPVNTVTVLRIAAGLRDDPRLAAFNDAVFNAMWAEKADLNDKDVIADVLTQADLSADELLPMAAEQANKDRLRENTDRAVAKGVFGAPSFLIGDELFWGQDRTEFVEYYVCQT